MAKEIKNNGIKVRGVFDDTSADVGTAFDFDPADVEVYKNNVRTVQADAEKCDLNALVKKFGVNVLAQANLDAVKQFGDVSEMLSYQDSLNMVIKAQEAFAALSADIRNRFDNDPAALISFLNDNRNYDEAVKLGLVQAKVIQKDPPKENLEKKEPSKV